MSRGSGTNVERPDSFGQRNLMRELLGPRPGCTTPPSGPGSSSGENDVSSEGEGVLASGAVGGTREGNHRGCPRGGTLGRNPVYSSGTR